MSFPQWKGLWDWSMKYADGTTPTNFRPEDVDPEKMKWLEEALKHYMVDFSARMQEIKTKLERDTVGQPGPDAAGATDQGAGGDAAAADLEEKEGLLEELMDIVSSIDYARDLHKIGGLPVLLELLDSPHSSLRWRAAEVVATCLANNPPVQQWFLDGGVLPKLLGLTATSQPAIVRTKALLALSGLVRHFDAGLQAMRQAGGLAAVVGCLASSDRRLSRKAMTMLAYMLGQRRADCPAAVRDGAIPPLISALNAGAAGGGATGAATDAEAESSSPQDDSDLRQAALSALLQLASYPGTWEAVRDAQGLRARLAALQAAHAALPADEQEAQEEELGLLRTLAELLAAAAPPALLPDEGGHVSVEAFEAAGRGTTFAVNEPQASGNAGRGDVGAGEGDQAGEGAGGGAGSGSNTAPQGEGPAAAGGQDQPVAAPLLLGAP